MTMPFYVAPEQVMKDRAEYAQKGIARGRSLVATIYADGVLIVAENPSRSLHKISEIYDRIAFAGVGKYNEYDQLRVAGVRHADTKGFAFSREDVDARSLANLYAQFLGNVFTHEMKPLEVEILVAELGGRRPSGPAVPHRLRGDDHRRGPLRRARRRRRDDRRAGRPRAGRRDRDLADGPRGRRGGAGRARAHPGSGRPRGGGAQPAQRPAGLPADHRRRAGRLLDGGPAWRHRGVEASRRPRRRARARPTTSAERPSGRPARAPGRPTGRPASARHRGGTTVARVDRRIFGLENEYGVTFTLRGQRRLSPDEVARYLFRRVVSWGRSSNVFLENGARLYLDVGSHPEYATPECDRIADLVTHDKAGEWILSQLVAGAQARLREEGIRGDVYLFKNNTDSAGNSYGCHENYLTERNDDFNRYTEVLIPFLVSRQIFAGAGKVLQTARGAVYCLSQRAEHIWEGVSSATTRSRPIINTRDEPHADAERFRRLHVIVGDSNMSEYATFLKVGTTSILLAMLEDSSTVLRDLTLENPIRAIREISHDITCQRRVRLANGREMRALDIQAEYLERALRFRDRRGLSARGGPGPRHVGALPEGPRVRPALAVAGVRLGGQVPPGRGGPRGATTCRWPTPRWPWSTSCTTTSTASAGLFYKLQARDQVERTCTDADIATAMTQPPRDHPGPPAGRLRPPGQGAPARLHRGLGAPQAERPGPAHRLAEGPVPFPRRPGRAPDRLPLT